MKVMKFGGSSLANAQGFFRVLEIILEGYRSKGNGLGVVLSAPATVTDLLQNHIVKTTTSNSAEIIPETLSAFIEKLLYELEQGNPVQIKRISNKYKKALQSEVKIQLAQIEKWMTGIQLLNKCPDSVFARMICVGERISVIIMKYLILSQNQSCEILNENIFISEGDYVNSEINIEKSQKCFQHTVNSETIYLLPGFIGINEQNETVLLGRNGSDYSAAVLAVLMKANCCEIWTDVNGIYNCDPNLIEDANLLHTLSYQEAMELSYFGARILHPKTIAPLHQYQISCIIKNTFNPKNCGTLISKTSVVRKDKVKAISSLENITMVNVSGSGLKGKVGMAGRLFGCLSRAGISIILITQSSSEYSISFAIESGSKENASNVLFQEFKLEFENQLLEPIEYIDELAILSLIGDGMHRSKGVSGRFLSALADADINIVAIAQGSSERSLSVVIQNSKVETAIKKTHQKFFEAKRFLNILLLGCGGVGSELLNQFRLHQSQLEQKLIGVRVFGIANSRQLLCNPKGIDLEHWLDNLKQCQEPFSLENIQAIVKENHLMDPILVDCSSDENLASSYNEFLNAGFHVVAANKKANTMGMNHYHLIRQIAQLKRRKFHYETNVGAGLPVIENLKNLILAGDQLQKFNGILSGSLSYIFGELDQGKSFSSVTRNAREKGFTEPDPRDDLSGMDVARKLLIIAREVGMELEMDDIEVESVLPEQFDGSGDINGFLENLSEVDSYFSALVNKAKEQQKVLRYVGTIENGKCSVAVKMIANNNPLFSVKSGENALAFYSQYYHPIPLLLRGYGAGIEVTAAGVYSDVLKILL